LFCSSSSTSSDEDNEMMDLKHDPFLEDNLISCDKITEKDIKNIQRFPPNAKLAIQIKHQVSKKKSNRGKLKFSCGLCKTSYKTYQILRRHKASAIHRFLEMKRFDNLRPPTNIKIEQNSIALPEITQLIENEDNISVTKEGQVNSYSSYSAPEETRSLRYNLRLQKKKSYCSTTNPANELDMDKYNKDSHDLNSTNMLSSDESDLEDDNEYTSSSLNNNRIEENTENDDESTPFYRCFLDNCKLKRIVFYKKSKLDQHKVLHIRGQYQCKFCDKVEGSPIKLSLHETEMHSAIPSTSTNTRTNNSIYYCARCPFETQKEGIYFKHFASIHLKILGDRSTSWECEICKRKFVRGKSRSKSHFKTHHDTSGLEDPELHVKKCSENDCSAYFLTQEQLRVHKILKHSASSYDNQLDQLINDMIEKNDATGCYKCLFCMKESSRFFNIQNHVRTFHQQMIENQTETSARTRNGKRLICPEIKCTKTFETLKGLEVHKKLHGTFACLFCDEVSNYAIDLAQHEYQSHTHSNNSKEQLKKILKFKCSRCPRNFQRLAGYTNHFVNAHLNISTIQSVCSICKFQCHTESLREHHLRNHYIVGMDPEKVSSCSKCPAYFRTYNQLYCHMKKLHQDPTKPKLLIHKCDKCDSTFSNPLYLEKHLDKEHPQTNISHNFKCNKCSRYFIRDVSLKIHMKNIHSGKRLENLKIHNIPKDNVNYPHQCFLDRCKRRFKDDKSLKLHQNLHKRGKYSCKFCDTVLDSILKLSMHESLYHSKKKGNKNNLYNCSRCQFENKSAKIYHTHFAQKHMGVIVKLKSSLNEKILGKHNCKFCEKEFVSASELGYHEAEHANKNTKAEEGKRPRIQCPRCHNTYTKLFYIKHYLKVHFGCTKKKQTVCPICQEKAVSPKKHFRKYHKTDDLEDPSNIYKCEGEDDNCNAYFIEYVQLIQHKRKTHQQLNGWACKDCDKKYSCEKGLQSHIRNSHAHLLENPNLPFPCDKGSCKRRFGTKGELEHHKKFARHKNCEVQVKCEKCNKEFLNKSTLKTHLNKSHSERSFFCQECGKVFKTKGNLKNHLEYHKGPDSWKFQCSTCGKKCVSKNVLDAHLRTHTGEKPYVCQYCGEKYAHIHNWKNHMLTKHKDEEDLPKIRKTPSTNRISRKGTKKGACVISEVQQ